VAAEGIKEEGDPLYIRLLFALIYRQNAHLSKPFQWIFSGYFPFGDFFDSIRADQPLTHARVGVC
jgi:hypothetical protein